VLPDLDERGARSLVQDYLDAMDPPRGDAWVVTRVTACDWGWIVYWLSRRAAEGSRDRRDLYIGNGPFLVDRSGRVARCGSARRPAHYVRLWQDGQLPDEPRPVKRDVLPGPWFDVRPRPGDSWATSRDAMAAELGRELAPGHPLHGQPAEALAKCWHCDSVLFALPGSRFAVVALTWTHGIELPPSPRAAVFTQWSAALAAIAEHGIEDLPVES